ADTIGAVIAHSQVILSPGDERLTVRWVPQDDGHPDHTVGLLVAEVGQEHLSKAELITLEVRRSESDTPYRFHWPRGSAVPVPRQQ
ncbi:MAG TPA: hypothetical protein VD902_01510, partial [Symbiobacteriaceae bacterium]|nr:hypothetical protein [Symbiobacteriaceae bacterium]